MEEQQPKELGFVYSVPVTEKLEGGTEIRRCPYTKDKLIEVADEGVFTLQDGWLNSVNKNGKRDCLSQRDSTGKYVAQTYDEVHENAKNLGAGVQHLNICPKINEFLDYELQFVGIYSKNRTEWLTIDIGCAHLQGMTVIPLYDTLGPENLSYCLNHTNLSTVFCSSKSVDTLLSTPDIAKLKTIIAIDQITEEQQKKSEERGVKLYTYQEVIEIGKQNPRDYAKVTKDSVFTFSYTSGTTGPPKGAMLTHGMMISALANFNHNDSLIMSNEDIHLSYLPLPHTFDRLICTTMIYFGGQIFFYSGDVQKITVDILDVKPTVFCSVPRLFNRFYDGFMQKLNASEPGKAALAAKIKEFRTNAVYTHEQYDELVFKPIREGFFGGRVRIMFTGSAPINKDVKDFFIVALSARMIEGYGQTETMASNFVTSHKDPESGHVGGIMVNAEFKLEDIPEMNYLSTDKNEQGQDAPRGEVLVRGPCIIKHYYKDEAKTKETIDKDGFIHTGDVGCLNSKTGSLSVIDRKKNIFKLSQGEYVAPEKIENIYMKALGVNEVFVYGDSLSAYLVGVVVPDQKYLKSLQKEFELDENLTYQDLCKEQKIRDKIQQNCFQQGKQEKLYGFEQVKILFLESTPFIVKGCVTNSLKLQRHQAKLTYAEEIKQLYKEEDERLKK